MKKITLFLLALLVPTVSVFSTEANELVGGSISLLCTDQFYRNMIYWPQEAATFTKEMLAYYGLDIGVKMPWTDEIGTAHDVRVFEVIQNGFYSSAQGDSPICDQFERTLRYPLPSRIINDIDMTVLRHTDDPVNPAIPSAMVIYHHCSTNIGIDIERWAYSFVNEQYDDAIIFEYVFTNVSSEPRQDVYFGFRACPGARLSGNPLWSNYYGAHYGDGTDSLRLFYNCNAASFLASQGQAPDDRARPSPWWGNFGNPQYLGYLVLHADKSSDDETDDPAAPRKAGWSGDYHTPNVQRDSHEAVYQYLSSPWKETIPWLYTEQDGMIRLRKPGRNKREINPQTEVPKIGLLSFGPYRMNPGDDVRIVLAFVGGSISERLAIDAGLAYDSGYETLKPRVPIPYAIPSLGIEAGQLLTMEDIDRILDTGRDSLFQNAGRLMRMWNRSDIRKGSGTADMEMAPPAPSVEIKAEENDIRIQWSNEAEMNETDIAGYRLYRLAVDSTGDDRPGVQEWAVIHEAASSEPHEFVDQDVRNGTDYFYYVTSFKTSGLESSPFLNRTEPDHPEQAVSPGRETGDFQKIYWKKIDKYDESGNVIEHLVQQWEAGQWVNYRKEIFSYAYAGVDSGLLTEYIYQIWDDNAWANTKKEEYAYDEQKQLTEKIQCRWNVPDAEWQNYRRWLYEYNEDDSVKDEWRQRWRRNSETGQYDWTDDVHSSFSYDPLGLLADKTREKWSGDHWENYKKQVFTYAESLLVEDLQLDWDGDNWVNERRKIYEYDENKNRISYTFQLWRETWQNYSRQLYAYDEQRRRTEIIRQGWEEGQWVFRYKTAYAYDSQDRIIEEWTYGWIYNTWIITRDEITKYEISTGVDQIAEAARDMHYQLLQNFPNPFNSTTTIQFMLPRSSRVTLEIYDITGRLVAAPIASERLSAGTHRVRWNGKDRFEHTVGSGIYLCVFKVADTFKETKQILFLK